ncbi:MAG: 50S ribosomal protein L19 [Candidatus Pacebacteria bacterium]|nr:50S ribosomal protein L19 [Candidatus Paceibacterota bacterium]
MILETIKISSVNIEDRKALGIRAGDTVRVWVKIEEKGKIRTQAFEGLVLARKHGNEAGATFTVRKVASGVGVERIFPLFSPIIDKIEIIKRSRVRRSKLYFIREKVAREIKRQMRKMKIVTLSTKSEKEEAERKVKEEEEKAKAEDQVKEETPVEENMDAPVETPVETESSEKEEEKK